MILFIQHVPIEGPETIGRFFEKRGFTFKSVELYKSQRFPQTLDDIDAVICLGGPMNVDEEDKYPFLKEETEFIRWIIKENIPYLGICLGSQLLAKAAQAKVVRSPQEEIGFFSIELTQEGIKDPLFKGIPQRLNIFQWHGDMFHIPFKGSLLARGHLCPHQALKVGQCAYGIQFHIEITDKSISEWCDEYFKNPEELRLKKTQMLKEYVKIKKEFHTLAEVIYENFLKIIQNQQKKKIPI